MKKIHLIGPYPPIKGGISKYNFFLAQELAKFCNTRVFSYKRQYPKFLLKNRNQIDEESSQLETELSDNRVEFIIDSLNPFTWFSVAQQIKNDCPDLVIFHWWVVYWIPMYLFFLAVLRFLKIKSLVVCHNVHEHESNFLKAKLSELTLTLFDKILVQSSNQKAKVKRFIKEERILFHFLPVYDFDFVDGRTKLSNSIKNTQLNILFFGFVRDYKGLDLVLAALGKLVDQSISLTVVGEFWDDKKKYLDTIKSYNIKNVKIIDRYVSDQEIESYFAQCDLTVLTYKDENATGSAVLSTSYAYKKPVLVTNVGGLPEAVIHKKTGYIVEPNTESIKNGILWFKDNMHLNFANSIGEFTTENLSWSSLASMIVNHIELG